METIIAMAGEMSCSDIHISEGMPMMFRQNGRLIPAPVQPRAEECRKLILECMDPLQRERFESGQDVDFAMQAAGMRERVNVFRYMGKIAATIRLLSQTIPALGELGLPAVLEQLSAEPRGLILVTGPTGSGKSTTLAAMIDTINQKRSEHILTVEDPVEYVYTPKMATIHQREVGRDVENFAGALRSALREDPDIILVGEMRDYETISAAVTAAETGHLVLSTLHTTGAAQTIDRIIDACPGAAQNQIRTQLAGIVRGVITQCLIPTASGTGRIPATEILLGTDAVLNLIRENKCYQLSTVMQSAVSQGMHTLNADLNRLLRSGQITRQSALQYSNNKKELEEYLL